MGFAFTMEDFAQDPLSGALRVVYTLWVPDIVWREGFLVVVDRVICSKQSTGFWHQ